MKKFLSILLALAVGFTFTFGSAMSAFADTKTADEAGWAAVEAEQADLAKAIDEFAGAIVYNQTGYLAMLPSKATVDANLTKTAIDYTLAQVKADYNQKIVAAEVEAVKDGVFNDTDAAAVKAAWEKVKNNIEEVVFTDYATTLYTKAVDDAKTAALAKVDAVNADDYVNAADVKAAKETAKTELNAVTKDAAGLAAVNAALDKLAAATPKENLVTNQAEALAKAKTEAKASVAKAAAEYKATREAEIKKVIENPASPAALAAANEEAATLATNVANVQALYEGRIDAVEITKDGAYKTLADAKAAITTQVGNANWAFANPTNFNDVISQFTDVDYLVKYAQDLAEAKKNEYSATTGLATYNAATVDAELAKIIVKIKSVDGTANSFAKVKALVDAIPTATAEKAALETKVTEGIAAITTGDYADSNWNKSEENQKAVKAIQKDYTAKIKAAATADEIDVLVKEAKKAMDAYLNNAGIKTLTGLYNDAMTKLHYNTSIPAYADKVALLDTANTYSAKTKSDAVEEANKVLLDAVIATQNAKLKAADVEEILKANYSAALAKIDAMKSDAALKADAKAIEDAIKALPTTATLENKADYIAVKDQLDAFKKLPGASTVNIANEVLLKAYISKIVKLEKDAAEKLVKDLPKTITVNDRAAVEAARAAVDAYKDTYEGFGQDYGYNAIDESVLAAKETALNNALNADLAKKIAALPANITKDDAAAVKAAREAYDALPEAAKAAFDKKSEALVKKLEAAEATLATLTKVTDDDVKAYLNTLKVTVKSAKTSKKNVKVTAKVTVKATGEAADFTKFTDAGYTFKYKFYRSTKTTVKYTVKKAKDTATWTNTAGKKGTKYYYKVKVFAYDKDGKFVGQTYQSQCNYTSKVFGK